MTIPLVGEAAELAKRVWQGIQTQAPPGGAKFVKDRFSKDLFRLRLCGPQGKWDRERASTSTRVLDD
jgi:hypothetical protein